MPAELLIQDVDMGNAVQERQYIAGRRHGRRDCRDCSIEVICLAGQDHRVIDRCHLRRDHGLHCYLRVSERALDPQPCSDSILRRPSRTRNVTSAPLSAKRPPK